MFDFNTLFSELSKAETCKVLTNEEKKSLSYNFSDGGTVWEITTELTFRNQVLEVRFYIDYPRDFPHAFPRILINREDYNEIKYIPHINEEMVVCIFDDGQNLLMPKNVTGLLGFMLSKAKRIIMASEDETANNEEFEKEFKAYWEEKYSGSDITSDKGMHTISEKTQHEINAIRFISELSGFEYFIYDNEEDLKKITDYAKKYNIGTVEAGVLLVENNFKAPPFEMSIADSIALIEKDAEQYKRFKELCNDYDLANILVIFCNKANGIDEYYGWSYQETTIQPRKISGVRNSSSRLAYLKNPIISKNNVKRISFQNSSFERLQKRTTGYVEQQLSIAVSGLGSVGSNLIFFLKNLPIDSYKLVDNQLLSIENINRHLLGFSFVKWSKANAVAQWLKSSNPLYDVEIKYDSVISVIKNKPTFINDCDFHIVAIGSTMIEEFILNNLIDGNLTKPTIIFWVEPFMASGQMLFIMPEDASKALKIITEANYKYAVLQNVDSQKDKTYIVEGSCQTGFSPYSSAYMVQFLSSIFPHLKQHLTEGNSNSTIYTWIGDKNLLDSQGLLITPFANGEDSFTLLKSNL